MQTYSAISVPEIIDLQPLDVTPFISEVDIKVFYLGNNDNGSSIDKDTALKMAKTLRGNPIVGWYSDKSEDFVDHGEEWVLNGEGFQVNCLTQPYGYVAPDSKVWFQWFREKDRKTGEMVDREYLMCKGYLWTGQFPEAAQAYKEGKGQSMELDDASIQGEWSHDWEFFVITDANISKLCLLGDEVEPCFEGASITAATTKFSLNENDSWSKMHTMIDELKFALEKGGKTTMPKPNENILDNQVQKPEDNFQLEGEENNTVVPQVPETKFEDGGEGGESGAEGGENGSTEGGENGATEGSEAGATEGNGTGENTGSSEAGSNEGEGGTDDDEGGIDPETEDLLDGTMNGAQKIYTQEDVDALNAQISELQEKYTALENEVTSLREFKLGIDRVDKQNKIAEFSMLSDEDKADVVANIDNYTVEDIESKLATICYKKKINFTKESDNDAQECGTTFSLNTASYMPDWVKAVKEKEEKNKL